MFDIIAKELIDKILIEYKIDEILYKAFSDYVIDLKTELQTRVEFKTKSIKVLDNIIRINKTEDMLFTYQIKILNITKEFNIADMVAVKIINELEDITEESSKDIVKKYIKEYFY